MSHHHKHQKLTVAKALLCRVNTHITDKTQKHSELQNKRSTLRLNEFPTKPTFFYFLMATLSEYTMQLFHFYSLHTRHIRESQKSSKRGRVKVAIKPIYTIGEILPSSKDPLTLQEKSCLVYQVPCFDCNFVYMGRLNWTLSHV